MIKKSSMQLVLILIVSFLVLMNGCGPEDSKLLKNSDRIMLDKLEKSGLAKEGADGEGGADGVAGGLGGLGAAGAAGKDGAAGKAGKDGADGMDLKIEIPEAIYLWVRYADFESEVMLGIADRKAFDNLCREVDVGKDGPAIDAKAAPGFPASVKAKQRDGAIAAPPILQKIHKVAPLVSNAFAVAGAKASDPGGSLSNLVDEKKHKLPVYVVGSKADVSDIGEVSNNQLALNIMALKAVVPAAMLSISKLANSYIDFIQFDKDIPANVFDVVLPEVDDADLYVSGVMAADSNKNLSIGDKEKDSYIEFGADALKVGFGDVGEVDGQRFYMGEDNLVEAVAPALLCISYPADVVEKKEVKE